MKTKAAVLYGPYYGNEPLKKIRPLVIEELELDEPKEGECLVKIMGSGICHSDHHMIDGVNPSTFPIVLGHEAGVRVEKLGKNCKKVKEGDHAIAAWMPACGHCHFCVSGTSWLCDRSENIMTGMLLDNTYRLHKGSENIAQWCFLGTFSEYAVIPEDCLTVISKEFALDKVGILGCAIPTGWGSAVNAAKVKLGSTCIVFGCGGVGTSAIQGCRHSGASIIIAVDHNNDKLARMKQFGATHTLNNKEVDILEAVRDLTNGIGVDYAIECIATAETRGLAVEALRKGGTAVFTGIHNHQYKTIDTSSHALTLNQKSIKGTVYGNCNMATDIPLLLKLYKSGQLLIDEMVTNTYRLEDINEAFDDMLNGTNIRGMIKFD